MPFIDPFPGNGFDSAFKHDTVNPPPPALSYHHKNAGIPLNGQVGCGIKLKNHLFHMKNNKNSLEKYGLTLIKS